MCVVVVAVDVSVVATHSLQEHRTQVFQKSEADQLAKQTDNVLLFARLGAESHPSDPRDKGGLEGRPTSRDGDHGRILLSLVGVVPAPRVVIQRIE